MNIRLFLVLCFFTTSFSAFSAESIRTVTGFYYPIGMTKDTIVKQEILDTIAKNIILKNNFPE
ncbi:MAG: hypothetical protein IPN70_04830 [Candidatus Moraniibacteriota bacterium]|nr:MAG: hypothetical protein IPN70_04830 [Candidatus Moranbacteria bacterium]